MIAVTFSAWKGDRYIGLAELLVVLGGSILDLWWEVDIDEMAPEPGAEALEALTSSGRVQTLELLRRAAPDFQIIDGRLTGYVDEDSGDALVRIAAVDSSSWDVESSFDHMLPALRERYEDLMPLPT